MATENGSTRTGLAALLAKGTVATIALGAGAVAVSTLAFPPPASAKGLALVIKTEHVGKVGTVLATGTGLTLYRYTVDPAGKATCTGACAKVWAPLLLPKGVTHIKAPHGVKGLTAIRVHGGRLQVFFHNHALYSFASDTKKGEATGQGVENDWFAVLSNGKSSASNAATTPTSTGGTGAGSNIGSNTGTEHEYGLEHRHDGTARHDPLTDRQLHVDSSHRATGHQVAAGHRPSDDRTAGHHSAADHDAADKPSHDHDDRSSDGRGGLLVRQAG